MVTSIQGGMPSKGVERRPAHELAAEKAGGGRKIAGDKSKAESNASVMTVSMQVSITAKNETMRLLLQSVATNLNDALKPYLGKGTAAETADVQEAAPAEPMATAAEVDYSPEATAQRIFQLATGFYEAFKQQHPGEEPDATLNHFLDVIKGGIDEGFKEARQVLDGLGVLQSDIATNIDKTYSLVQTKLDDWQKQMLEGLKTAQAPASEASVKPASSSSGSSPQA